MAETLKDRFLFTVFSPLSILLNFAGVFVNPYPDSQWRRRLYRFWTFFLLILAIQANVYIFVKRTLIKEFFFASQKINVNRFIWVFINELLRFSSLVSDSIIQIILVFKVWPSVNLFLEILDSVDLDLERPKLTSIKRYSFFGLIYLLFTIIFNLICGIVYDLIHLTRRVNWFDILQNSIRIFSNQGFAVTPVWIFIICGQLYLFFVRKLVEKLNVLYFEVKNTKGTIQNEIITLRIFAILRSLKQLYLAADLLYLHFSTILMLDCLMAFITMLTSAYYVIEFIQSGHSMVVVCWDSSEVIDSFIRFWLICHTSDRIRESTTESIFALRSFRDTRIAETFTECNKITSYIIEISQISKNMERHSLKGILPLSKRLIIPTLETIFVYLLIIHQFKNAAK